MAAKRSLASKYSIVKMVNLTSNEERRNLVKKSEVAISKSRAISSRVVGSQDALNYSQLGNLVTYITLQRRTSRDQVS